MADMENGIDTTNTVPTYAEAFPPLSSQSPTNLEVNEVNDTSPKTSWGSSSTHAIPTSTVTQVYITRNTIHYSIYRKPILIQHYNTLFLFIENLLSYSITTHCFYL